MPFALDDIWADRLKKMWKMLCGGGIKITGGDGIEVKTSVSDGSLRVQISTQKPTATPSGPVWMQLGAGVQDGSNKRWYYPCNEVRWTGSGDNWTWEEPDSPRSGRAYNGVESQNIGAVTAYGNGVTVANLSGTFNIVPILDGVIVLCWYVGNDGTRDIYYFTAVNQIDGACPA